MSGKIIPYLWFDSQAEEAAKFYTSAFRNSKVGSVMRYGEAGAKVSGRPEGSVLTVEFQLAGQQFVALNGGPVFAFTPAISLYVGCRTAGEVDRLYAALSVDGKILMPLDKYKFSDRYAWFTDRFGLSWQLFRGKSDQKITPCLMFMGRHYGQAMEAIRFYGSVFKRTTVGIVAPYEKAEGEKEGAVKHAEFSLSGSHFIAMDSGKSFDFTMTPAVSFLVPCKDQAEVDNFWNGLSAVPQAEQCGWLQDKYGVSWQIVPEQMHKLLKDRDPLKSERVMEAMIPMKKLDIVALQKAYEGK